MILMLQKDLTYGQVSFALYQYLVSLLSRSAGPDYLNINDKLIRSRFLTLLKKMPEIKSNHRKFILTYSNEPLETGYVKLFPSMTMEVRSGPELLKKYGLVVEGRGGEEKLYIESDGYTIDSWPIEKMTSIQNGEEILSKPIEFDLSPEKPSFDEFEEFLRDQW